MSLSDGTPSRRASAVIALVGWTVIGVGGAVNGGRFSGPGVALVTVGTVLLLLVAFRSPVPIGRWTRVGATVVLVTVVAVATVLPAPSYGAGDSILVCQALTLAVAVAVFVVWWHRPDSFRAVTYLSIVVMVGAGVAMIVSSPKPPNDVWYTLQAAGHALSHGRNIYTTKWTTGVPGELSNGFAYLPGSAVLLWPFHAVFGDVRYGLLAALAATAFLLVRFGHGPFGILAGSLVLLYPRVLFGVEQSWIDPLLVMAVAAMVVLMTHKRHGWAVIALAVCLACKQQAWLVLPLAAFWKDFGWRRALLSACGAVAFIVPWVVAAPAAFYNGAISHDLFLPPAATQNALSLYDLAFRDGLNLGFGCTVFATVVALVLCAWRLPRDAFGFCLGGGIVEAVFNLASKQSYFNEWELVAGLLLVAVAFALPRHDERSIDDRDVLMDFESPPVGLQAIASASGTMLQGGA
jgi:hypothetical protein